MKVPSLKRRADRASVPSSTEGPGGRYVFELFITGATPNSTRAIKNIRRICDTQLPGRHQLVIVDVYRETKRAVADQIVATPALVRRMPLPERRLVGDLSDVQRVMSALDLPSS